MRVLCGVFLMLASESAMLRQEKEGPKVRTGSPGELVQALANTDFATRAAAEKELLRLGHAAVPAIQEGLKSKDANVQTRCEQLLLNIQKQDGSARLTISGRCQRRTAS